MLSCTKLAFISTAIKQWKRTNEYDYSQLNLHMVYFLRGQALGSEGAYNRTFDGEHRDRVKEALNAMIQASLLMRTSIVLKT